MLAQLKSGHRPHQIVARDSAQTLTSAQLLERSRKLARDLGACKVRVVALHADNSLDWLVADLACQLASVCLVPLPTFFSTEQLLHVFNSIPVDAVICEHAELFDGMLANIRQRERSICGKLDLLLLNESNHPAGVFPPATQKITFTSGSTGAPKGVCLSARQMMQQARALALAVNLPEPRHLCVLPLTTLLENVAGLYAPLLAGGEVIIPRLSEIGFTGSSSFEVGALIETIHQYGPNSMILTPQLLVALVAAAHAGWRVPASLRFVAVGGSSVAPDLVREAHACGLPVYEGYGLSECVSVVSLNRPQQFNHNSCGRPLSHLAVELENGEIVVAGNAMLGYVAEPGSWGSQRIYTGDLGWLDDKGYLYIKGRKKNLLISSFGRNIHPEWVESKLLSHASISECVLFGDGKPYCTALLSARNPGEDDQSIQRIINQINASLPDYARVRKWRRLPQPLTATKFLITGNGRPRRQAINQHYGGLIDALYADELVEQAG